uniref:Uncharacterized protein n=1 Tax=Haemonchus contortus TaxID=6289 RepID=A0A7I4XRS2_HAECO
MSDSMSRKSFTQATRRDTDKDLNVTCSITARKRTWKIRFSRFGTGWSLWLLAIRTFLLHRITPRISEHYLNFSTNPEFQKALVRVNVSENTGKPFNTSILLMLRIGSS